MGVVKDAMRTSERPAATAPPQAPGSDPAGEWLAKRGVLFLLLQLPALGVMVSYLSGLERLTSAVYPVFVAFTAMAAWVAFRKARSRDPDEPVHRLHLYLLYALLPVAVFSLVQIPSFLAGAPAYWATWLELGTQFSASGVDPWSFLAGVVWSALIGIGLVLGYFVLYRRHTAVNAGLYFAVVLVATAYLLPAFSPALQDAGVLWYVTQVIAFAAVAATAWAMPAFWAWAARSASGRLRPRLPVLAGAALVLLAPLAFAAERTANWQLADQEDRDLAAFDQVTLEPNGPPVLLGVDGPTASYQLALRLGPRGYTTAVGAARAVDAGPIVLEGELVAGSATAAWCSGYVAELASPNPLRHPARFAVEARRLEHVDVALTCSGPVELVAEHVCHRGGMVTARWRAEATLVGERVTQDRELSGETRTRLEDSDGVMC